MNSLVPHLRVYLLRHGEVENSSELKLSGQQDVLLTSRGEKQSKRLAEILSQRKISAVFSSDLYRAKRGAELLAKRLGLKPQKYKELREFNFGEWEGLDWKEVAEKVKDSEIDWKNFKFPSGESLLQFQERILRVYQDLIQNQKGEIAIFAHGGVNRIILCKELGIPLENMFRIDQSYACLNLIEYYPTAFGGYMPFVRLLNSDVESLKFLGLV